MDTTKDHRNMTSLSHMLILQPGKAFLTTEWIPDLV